jgi:hypothetical protein
MIPTVLVGLGAYLLVGCFPIPTLRQSQPDGTPRPEHFIGAERAVRVGYTHIDDAIIILSQHLQHKSDPGTSYLWASSPRRFFDPKWAIAAWTATADHRRFSMKYSVHTATWVFPICFAVAPVNDERWLTLDADENGIVTHVMTTDKPVIPRIPAAQWLEIFNEPTRRKFRAARVMPSDDVLRAKESQWRTAQEPLGGFCK